MLCPPAAQAPRHNSSALRSPVRPSPTVRPQTPRTYLRWVAGVARSLVANHQFCPASSLAPSHTTCCRNVHFYCFFASGVLLQRAAEAARRHRVGLTFSQQPARHHSRPEHDAACPPQAKTKQLVLHQKIRRKKREDAEQLAHTRETAQRGFPLCERPPLCEVARRLGLRGERHLPRKCPLKTFSYS